MIRLQSTWGQLATLAVSLLGWQTATGQTRIYGTATYNQISPVAGATLLIDGSYDGGTTDEKGRFSFVTTETGDLRLIAKADGFQDVVLQLSIKDTLAVKSSVVFTLKTHRLREVIVRPKPFAMSDENRTTVMSTLDILTTAHDGNITTAVRALPGAQQIGESADLFIRGGTGAETKTYMDGLLVNHFNYSTPPNIASRSRFPAGLFKGTYFSSGGYSALYGQALSSTLALESEDIPLKSSADLSVSPVFASAGIQKVSREKNRMVGGTLSYTNLTPYFSVYRPNTYDFVRKPEYLDGNAMFRIKTPRNGILKFYGSFGGSTLALKQPNLNQPGRMDSVGLTNRNLYTNLSWKQPLGKRWKLYVGTAYSTNQDVNQVRTGERLSSSGTLSDDDRSVLAQFRSVLTRPIGARSKLHVGGELYHSLESSKETGRTRQQIIDNYWAGFAEADLYLSEKLSGRVGLRTEYSSLMGRANLAPRLSLGYQLRPDEMLTLSYGRFYQKPERNFLLLNPTMLFTQADHFIAGYQKADRYRTLRAEVFYKPYDQLVTTTTARPRNQGYGYAGGAELFWRDRKTIKDLDYWVSYSFLDTKRLFLDFPILTQPNFAARHTATAVAKRYFPDWSTNISLSYTYASGRPYFNPARSDAAFMSDRTIDYHNLALNLAYLPTIGKTFSVVVLTISNILGNQQVFGYTYSTVDVTRRQAIRPLNNPFVFLGMFVNFGVDRREEIINGRL